MPVGRKASSIVGPSARGPKRNATNWQCHRSTKLWCQHIAPAIGRVPQTDSDLQKELGPHQPFDRKDLGESPQPMTAAAYTLILSRDRFLNRSPHEYSRCDESQAMTKLRICPHDARLVFRELRRLLG